MEFRYVSTEADWSALRDQGATTVLDPTVLRVAGVFSRGSAQAMDPDWNDWKWQVIQSNLLSLATFVDALILEECLPIFDYAIDPLGLRGYLGLLDEFPERGLLDELEPVIIPVRVADPEWMGLHLEAALALGAAQQIPSAHAKEIRTQLDTLLWTSLERDAPDEMRIDSELVKKRNTLKRHDFEALFDRDVPLAEPTIEWMTVDVSGDQVVNNYLFVLHLFSQFSAQLDGIQVLTKIILLASLGAKTLGSSA